jgi:PAS domain S-box-containing protein
VAPLHASGARAEILASAALFGYTPREQQRDQTVAQRTARASGSRSDAGVVPLPLAAEPRQAWLAALVESSFDAILSKNLDGTITSWNAAAERMYGYPAADVIGRSIELIVPEDRLAELRDMDAQLARGERVLPLETERLTRDGRRIEVQLTMSPILDEQGRVIGASGIGRDITERRRSEQRQRRLIEELNHRVRNTLAIAQSLATQTLRHSPSPEPFAAAFQGRLTALARTHTLLAEASWEGVRLQALIHAQLDPYRPADPDRVTIAGADPALGSEPALALGLALHELSTNATRHGALRSPSGRLEITAEVVTDGEGRRLLLTWRERGGPRVDRTAKPGFGRTLIEHGLAYQLGGDARFELKAGGVRCTIAVPLADRARLQPAGGRLMDGEVDSHA